MVTVRRYVQNVVPLLENMPSKIELKNIYFTRPSSRRNDPSFKSKDEDPMEEILKNLKERHRRTVERKLEDGADIVWDDEKGIINDETGEVVVDIRIIRGDFENFGISRDDSDGEENDGNGKEKNNIEDKVIKKEDIVVSQSNDKKNENVAEEEVVDTFKELDDDDLSEDQLGVVREDNEINK